MNRKVIFTICIIVAVVSIALLLVINMGFLRPVEVLSSHNPQVAALKDYIFKDNAVLAGVDSDMSNAPLKLDFYVVFLSICDAKERAIVIKGTGKTLDSAWRDADKKAMAVVKSKNYRVVWAKADIVNSAEEILTVDLNKEVVKDYYRYFYRKGVAFDKNFGTAFIEAEINGNKLIRYYTEDEILHNKVDYDSVILDIDNINYYRKQFYNLEPVKEIPEKITVFTATGFFCGGDNIVYELYNEGLDYGRRITGAADDIKIKGALLSASKFLQEQIKPDGEFKYGHYPVFDNPLEGYNTIRHICALWSLIGNSYPMTGDPELIPKIDAALDFLISGHIEYVDDDTAYVLERTENEVRLGGNAVAVIMLTEYMDVFGTDKYMGLVTHLSNGILELENPDDGTFYHVLNYPDFSRKEEFRVIYYDGEATFALVRAYAATGDEKYLRGAAAAVENFIKNDYTKYTDHWVAYSLNEITKHIPDERYFEFALKNVAVNLDTIYFSETTFHTYLELLMAGWQTYKRVKESGIKPGYIDEFDEKRFAETIYRRASHMLNGYFYPEFAMYMRYPYKIEGSFFVRHDDFRVRIDDVQHFISGYYKYIQHHREILPLI